MSTKYFNRSQTKSIKNIKLRFNIIYFLIYQPPPQKKKNSSLTIISKGISLGAEESPTVLGSWLSQLITCLFEPVFPDHLHKHRGPHSCSAYRLHWLCCPLVSRPCRTHCIHRHLQRIRSPGPNGQDTRMSKSGGRGRVMN